MKNQTDGGDEDRRKQEAGLDEALAQTFPASDPFSVGQFTATEPPSRPADRKAPEIVTADVHAGDAEGASHYDANVEGRG
jgi:hypothetical protein